MSWNKDIRKTNVSLVTAHLEDGSTREIPIKNTKKKWSHLEGILDGLTWEWIEGFDLEGNCVFSYQSEDVEDPENEDEDFSIKKFESVKSRDAQILELLTSAQRMVMNEVRQSQTEITTVLVDAYKDLASVLIERVANLEEKHAEMLNDLEATVRSQVKEEKTDIGETVLNKVIESVDPTLVAGLLNSMQARKNQGDLDD